MYGEEEHVHRLEARIIEKSEVGLSVRASWRSNRATSTICVLDGRHSNRRRRNLIGVGEVSGGGATKLLMKHNKQS